MRILHVYSGNLFGGIETILTTLARHADGGLKQEFALAFEGRLSRELTASGKTVHLLGTVRMSRPPTIFAARRALKALLQANAFDRVICHAPWSQAVFGPVVKRAAIPLVFWAHDMMNGCHWTERLARRTRPDLVICNSAFTAGTLPRLYRGVSSEVVYAPVDAPSGIVGPDQRIALRRTCRTEPDAVVIVQASRSAAMKGHMLLLEALGAIRDIPNWVWWQIGGAQSASEEAFLASLREAADRFGISDRVRWLGERTDVAQLLAAADIYAQANLAPEAFGIAFIEALFAGLPVVTADLGGAREIVDGSCGLLVEARHAGAFASALRGLVADPDARRALARGATARARLLCDPAAQLARLVTVLEAMSPVGFEA